MRQIKFRGRDGRGNVFFGDLVHVSKNQVVIHDKYGLNHPVKPESVAQLVDCDIDGTEYYEGDERLIDGVTHVGSLTVQWEVKS